MKRITIMKMMVYLFVLVIMLTACSSKSPSETTMDSSKESSQEESATSDSIESSETDDAEEPVDSQTVILKPYDDICRLFKRKTSGVVLEENQFKPGDIYTYTFDNANIFKDSEDLACEILENGKDPGLGIRNLHKQGITGYY